MRLRVGSLQLDGQLLADGQPYPGYYQGGLGGGAGGGIRVDADVVSGGGLIRAGGIRLRPILMTTLCTLFGLMPLALGLGAGAELQKPLAIAVIGGLSVSTIVTLVFVPTLLSVLPHSKTTSA